MRVNHETCYSSPHPRTFTAEQEMICPGLSPDQCPLIFSVSSNPHFSHEGGKIRDLIDRLTYPRSSTMNCRTQIFLFHSIAAEAKRLLFNSDYIIPHHRHSLVQENQWEGGQEEKEHTSKTHKLMSPRNSIFICFTAWGGK